MAGGRDADRARELLAVSLAGVTPPNIATALPGMVSEGSPFGAMAYAYALEHWEALAELSGDAMFGRYWLLPEAAQGFNDQADAARLIDDQQRVAGANGTQPAARIAARIALLAEVKRRDAAALQGLLASR